MKGMPEKYIIEINILEYGISLYSCKYLYVTIKKIKICTELKGFVFKTHGEHRAKD